MPPSLHLVRRALRAVSAAVDDDRGDVPGWVLITLMTAGLPVLTKMGSKYKRPHPVAAG
jgi:hypothetical protein